MTYPRAAVAAPKFQPIRFGLFSVADVREQNDALWSVGGIQFDNLVGCGPLGVAVQPCDTPASKADRLTPEFPEGDPYAAYAVVECQGPSFFNEAKDAATAALTFGAERAVEGAVMTQLLADATDHTPSSGALEAAAGIALLEGLWGQYGGAFEPTLHLDRTVAHLGWKSLDRHGNHLETELGSQVAAGSGYFSPAYDETTGLAWIVASGPFVIYRGVKQAHDPVFVGGSSNTDNTWVALAEQSFSWAYACTPIKVHVNSISDLGSL